MIEMIDMSDIVVETINNYIGIDPSELFQYWKNQEVRRFLSW